MANGLGPRLLTRGRVLYGRPQCTGELPSTLRAAIKYQYAGGDQVLAPFAIEGGHKVPVRWRRSGAGASCNSPTPPSNPAHGSSNPPDALQPYPDAPPAPHALLPGSTRLPYRTLTARTHERRQAPPARGEECTTKGDHCGPREGKRPSVGYVIPQRESTV